MCVVSGKEKHHDGWVLLFRKGEFVPAYQTVWSEVSPQYFKTKEEAEAAAQYLKIGGWAKCQ